MNSAPEPVLASLGGLGEDGARTLVRRRESGERFTTFADLRLRSSAARLEAVMMPSRLLVVSRGWQVGHPLTHEIQAVYAIVGTTLRLVSWREGDR